MSFTFFTPGPAQLHPQYATYVQQSIDMQLGSYSHRSSLFKDVYKHTDEQLRILLNIPKTHSIFFASSATEVWERLILNTVNKNSFHLVNGAFSKKFYQYALALQKNALQHTVNFGHGFSVNDIDISADVELICTTQNETSTGVQMPETDLVALKKKNPKALICTDLVSTAPHANINFEFMDSAFFSVQKAFGMPAGLGVWIVNEACIAKSLELQSKGCNIGAHHTLADYVKNYKTFETPSTPNMLAIYILGKIVENFNSIGIDVIRKETEAKAKFIYDGLENSKTFTPLVTNKLHQSATVAVFETAISSEQIIADVKKHNLVLGSGYGQFKETHIRIANFPSITMQDMQGLISILKQY